MIKVVLASDSTVTVAGKAIVVQYCNNARGVSLECEKDKKHLKTYNLWRVDKFLPIHLTDITEVGNTRFELVTSCLSSKRSKPTELIAH